MVHAFVCTRVDFSNRLLYGTSAYLLDRLQSVLNSAARLIFKIGKYDPISAAIRRDLHWLPIQYRIQFKFNSITSNCLAGRASEYLIELCHFGNDITARRNLRSSSQFQLLVPRYRKERSGRRGFSVSAPQLWNLLPANIRLLHNERQLFRKGLKTHYTCNSPRYATEDLCHQCDLYYYYYYYICSALSRLQIFSLHCPCLSPMSQYALDTIMLCKSCHSYYAMHHGLSRWKIYNSLNLDQTHLTLALAASSTLAPAPSVSPIKKNWKTHFNFTFGSISTSLSKSD